MSFPANPVVRPPTRTELVGPAGDESAGGTGKERVEEGLEDDEAECWVPGAKVLVRTRAHVWVYRGPLGELVRPSVRSGWDWEERLREAMEAGGVAVPG